MRKQFLPVLVALLAAGTISAQGKKAEPAASEKKTIISVWAGYNIASSKYNDIFDTTYGTVKDKITSSKGGIAAGADIWLGDSKLQYGGSLSYLPIYSWKYEDTASNSSIKFSLGVVPILAQVRYFVIPNLYVGGQAGYAIGISTAEVKVSGTTYAAAGGGSALMIGALAGYNLPLTDRLDLGLVLRFSFILTSEMITSINPAIVASFKL